MMHEDLKEMYGMEACMESVKFRVDVLHENPFEALGRAVIRGEQDVFFNKSMIDAWKQYIRESGLKWNEGR